MRLVQVKAKAVRLPQEAVDAIRNGDAVELTHYGKRRAVILGEDDFSLVEPLLDLLKQGAALPAELAMSGTDIALEQALADQRQPSPGENELIEQALTTLA